MNESKQKIETAQRELARIRQEFRQMEVLRAEVSSLREQSQKAWGWQEAVAEIRRDVEVANRTLPEFRIDLREQLQRTAGWLSEIAEIRDKGEHTNQALSALEASFREFGAFRQAMQAMEALPSVVREADRRGHQLQRELALQERRLSLALEEVRRRNGQVAEQAIPNGGAEEFLDPMYVHFEDVFRGTRKDIRERLEIYVPILKQANVGGCDMPVLDLGCGRGEWLELLSENGMSACGVDSNPVMVELCKGIKLNAERHDLLTYLRSVKSESLGAVTGFHVVEHLPFPILMAMIDEVARGLRPNGICIFETPNPANLRVSAYTFYLDPTHLNPIPKELLSFLLEARGLCRIEAMDLHPYPDSFRLPEDGRPSTQLLNDMMFGSQDYAVIGRKV